MPVAARTFFGFRYQETSGPNTLLAISESMSIIHRRCRQFGCSPPQFCVFLNSLPSNDFNTVFMTLPKFQEGMREENGQDFGPCYIAGVPGSFYGRLFPAKRLHFVQSSTGLHWLSQVPVELSDQSNKALVNKGKIYISRTSPPGVTEAYLNQFSRDFSSFLKSRSGRSPGGRMVLTLMGRRTPNPSPDESCLLWDYLGVRTSISGLGLTVPNRMESRATRISAMEGLCTAAPVLLLRDYRLWERKLHKEVKDAGTFKMKHGEICQIKRHGAVSAAA